MCRRILSLFVCLVAAGCGSSGETGSDLTTNDVVAGDVVPSDVESDAGIPLETAALTAPQGVAVGGVYLFVTSTGFVYGTDGTVQYQPGAVAVIRLSDLAVVNRILTSAQNPQTVVVRGEQVLVLCSGETTFDMTAGIVLPKTPGALDAFDVSSVATAKTPVWSVPLPLNGELPLVGYPTRLVLDDSGSVAYAASGTAPALFKFDLTAHTVLRGTDNPILVGDGTVQDLLAVVAGPSRTLLVGTYTTDTVSVLDMRTDLPATDPFDTRKVGKTSATEGILDLVVQAGEPSVLYVLLGIGNTVSRVTLDASGTVENGFAMTGMSANRLALSGATLYVLNSGDNNITRVGVSDGAAVGEPLPLPVGSNPYDLVVDADTGLLYVSGWASNVVYVVNPMDGQVREIR